MKPKLFESLQTQSRQFLEQKQAYEQLKQKIEHPFLKRYVQMGVKEGFLAMWLAPWDVCMIRLCRALGLS